MAILRATLVAICLLMTIYPAGAAQKTGLTSIRVAMGYIANVQFAPFYVAAAKGYYRRSGLDVHFNYGIEPDLLRLAAVGKVDFVNSGGDEVLTARSQGLRVRYVMTQYTRFPAAVFALRSSHIRQVRDLRGRSIGIPGPYGASYVGLLALIRSAHLPLSSVSIRSIGFTQPESVAHHRVDAAVGYAMNEPIYLRQQGFQLNEFDIYRWANIAGAGIAAGDGEIAHHPDIVRAFVRATLQGMRDTLQHPDEAYKISMTAIRIKTPARIQRAVLQRSLAFWRPERGFPLGWTDSSVWQHTATLLYTFKQIPHPVDARQAFTNQFLSSL